MNLTFHLDTIGTVNFRFCRSSGGLRRYFPMKLEISNQGCGVQALYGTERGYLDFCMSLDLLFLPDVYF